MLRAPPGSPSAIASSPCASATTAFGKPGYWRASPKCGQRLSGLVEPSPARSAPGQVSPSRRRPPESGTPATTLPPDERRLGAARLRSLAVGELGEEPVSRAAALVREPRSRASSRPSPIQRAAVLVLVAFDERPECDAGRRSEARSVVGEKAALKRAPGRVNRLLRRLGTLDPPLGEHREDRALRARLTRQLGRELVEPGVELVVVADVELQASDRAASSRRRDSVAEASRSQRSSSVRASSSSSSRRPRCQSTLRSSATSSSRSPRSSARAKRRPQMVHGACGIGPERLRSAQLEEHPGALARRRRLGEGAPEERRRRLGRAVLERRPRGAMKLVHDPLVARGRRLQQVRAYDLARGALAREQARRARVEEGPRARGLVLEDGRAHDRVDETGAAPTRPGRPAPQANRRAGGPPRGPAPRARRRAAARRPAPSARPSEPAGAHRERPSRFGSGSSARCSAGRASPTAAPRPPSGSRPRLGASRRARRAGTGCPGRRDGMPRRTPDPPRPAARPPQPRTLQG